MVFTKEKLSSEYIYVCDDGTKLMYRDGYFMEYKPVSHDTVQDLLGKTDRTSTKPMPVFSDYHNDLTHKYDRNKTIIYVYGLKVMAKHFPGNIPDYNDCVMLYKRQTADSNLTESAAKTQCFRYTYGSSSAYPFYGGWTEIIAPTRELADALFIALHPNKNGTLLNCAFVYDEKQWTDTEMCKHNDNMGAHCHEKYVITQEFGPMLLGNR